MLCLWQWIGLYYRRYGIKGLCGFVCDTSNPKIFQSLFDFLFLCVIFHKTKHVPRFSIKRFFLYKKRIPLKSSVETGNYKLSAPVNLTGFVKHLSPFKGVHFRFTPTGRGKDGGLAIMVSNDNSDRAKFQVGRFISHQRFPVYFLINTWIAYENRL